MSNYFKKSIIVSGQLGDFAGTIEIFFNARKDLINAHNPSTHDDEPRQINIHRIRANAIAKPGQYQQAIVYEEEFRSQEQAPILATKAELALKTILTMRANVPREKSVKQKLKDDGFTDEPNGVEGSGSGTE